MRDRLFSTAAAVAIAAGAMVALPTGPWAQSSEPSGGIITSLSNSATISTKGMSPDAEIWAEWYSLPAGKAVAESASSAKWAYVEMALDGEAVVTGPPSPMCKYFNAGGRSAPTADTITDAGDMTVCNYAILPGTRTENRGTKPYVFAGLAVGGPWEEGTQDSADLYLNVNGLAKTAHVTAKQFGDVQKELLKAGAMTVVIRDVTMPPGTRIVTADRYPTLRMVENGQLTLSADNSGAASSKAFAALEMMEWAPANADKQIVLSNNSDQPVEFVEWTVAPAQGVKP